MSLNIGEIGVFTELGALEKVLIHCPDQGVANVVPSKAQEWLYEDIVHLPKMKQEYAQFKKLLLAYLDPELLKVWIQKENEGIEPGSLASPYSDHYLKSHKVIDAQDALIEALEIPQVRTDIVASICAVEDTGYHIQRFLMDEHAVSAKELSRILITGIVEEGRIPTYPHSMVFAPVPNFLFTRDIGITVRNHVILSRTASGARSRESILSRYIAYHVLLNKQYARVLEMTDPENFFMLDDRAKERAKITLEGGDIMMISPQHLLIGVSERTSPYAAQSIVEEVFKEEVGIKKVSVVRLPKTRAMMHLDTVMTQVSRSAWVLFKQLVRSDDLYTKKVVSDLGVVDPKNAQKAIVVQFKRLSNGFGNNRDITCIKDLLYDISCNDFGCKKEDVKFIYSGQGGMLFDEREQWTDSCNVVALREGQVVGYDRNERTAEGFRDAGFEPVEVADVLEKIANKVLENPDVDIAGFIDEIVPKQALLMINSAELSRARGGPHCMTMPIKRAEL
jgi:arginine deiminase